MPAPCSSVSLYELHCFVGHSRCRIMFKTRGTIALQLCLPYIWYLVHATQTRTECEHNDQTAGEITQICFLFCVGNNTQHDCKQYNEHEWQINHSFYWQNPVLLFDLKLSFSIDRLKLDLNRKRASTRNIRCVDKTKAVRSSR